MRGKVRQFWHDHSLGIVLGLICLVLFALSWPLGKATWTPGDGPYWRIWLANLTYSLAANLFGVFLLVVLTKHLIERGSPESKE